MPDLNQLRPTARSAAMRGGTASWGEYGNSQEHIRYAEPVNSRSRKRCYCGCRMRATHKGMCNGVAMTSGCQLTIARWVRQGN
jgi:hypothetical protein